MASDLQTGTPLKLDRAIEIGQQYIDGGYTPGFIMAALRGDGPVEHVALGADASGRALQPDSFFPVASVTKLATALAALRLVDARALDLDTPVDRYLPGEPATANGATVRQVLCHTAGLAEDPGDWAPPYAPGLDWPALARACLSAPPAGAPGQEVVYSNIGPGILAALVERHTGRDFRLALRDLVLGPLGIEATLGDEPPREPARVAQPPDEHTGTPLEGYNSAFWRSLALPWGGLVTTAEGALRLVWALAGWPDGFLSPGLRAEAVRDQTGGLPGRMLGRNYSGGCPWGLGPDLHGTKSPHWIPAESSPETFGHAGASGCVVWHDPGRDVSAAILGPQALAGTEVALGWHFHGLPAIGAAILAAA